MEIKFRHYREVHKGYQETLSIEILCDSVSESAPIHNDGKVKSFAKLEADLSQIPKVDAIKLIRNKADGDDYYVFEGAVEATFGSASMKYVLVVEGERNVYLAGVTDSSQLFRGPV